MLSLLRPCYCTLQTKCSSDEAPSPYAFLTLELELLGCCFFFVFFAIFFFLKPTFGQTLCGNWPVVRWQESRKGLNSFFFILSDVFTSSCNIMTFRCLHLYDSSRLAPSGAATWNSYLPLHVMFGWSSIPTSLLQAFPFTLKRSHFLRRDEILLRACLSLGFVRVVNFDAERYFLSKSKELKIDYLLLNLIRLMRGRL